MLGVTTLSRLLFVRLTPAVAWLLLLASVATLARGETAADDPNAVLRRFLGAWQTEARLHKVGPPASDVVTRGTAACQQTLGNRYFEFRTETVPAGESDLQIMTYDPDSRLYRQWVFSSDGYSHAAAGRWDAATSTLEWRRQVGRRRICDSRPLGFQGSTRVDPAAHSSRWHAGANDHGHGVAHRQ